MLNLDYKWMKLALKEAKLIKNNLEVPVGAVLVDLSSNQLISKSSNKIIKKSNPLLHAEIEVILKGIKHYKKKKML